MKNMKVNMGGMYFYNSQAVMAMEKVGNKRWLVRTCVDMRVDKVPYDLAGTDTVVNEDSLKELASEVFNLNQVVRNKQTHSFTGIVVGFEYDTNKVICRSNKIDSYEIKATRYAYDLDKLEVYNEDEITFVPGKQYSWNNWTGMASLAVENPDNPEYIMLVSHYGKVVHRSIPKVTTKRYLACNFNMSKIRERS